MNRFHLCVFAAIFCLAAGTDPTTHAPEHVKKPMTDEECKKVLPERMEKLKEWLTHWLAQHKDSPGPLGPEICQNNEVEKQLTNFGMVKIECDKAGHQANFLFPGTEYNEWNAKCPSHPEADATTTGAEHPDDTEEQFEDAEDHTDGVEDEHHDDHEAEHPEDAEGEHHEGEEGEHHEGEEEDHEEL